MFGAGGEGWREQWVNSSNFSENSSWNDILRALNTTPVTAWFDQIQGQKKLQEGKQVELAASCRNTCLEKTSAAEWTGRGPLVRKPNDLAGNFPPSSCGCLFSLQLSQARAWQRGKKCHPRLCHLEDLPALQWLWYRGQNYGFTVKPSRVKPCFTVKPGSE